MQSRVAASQRRKVCSELQAKSFSLDSLGVQVLNMSLNCAMQPHHWYTGNLFVYKVIFNVLALFEGEKTDLETLLVYLKETS